MKSTRRSSPVAQTAVYVPTPKFGFWAMSCGLMRNNWGCQTLSIEAFTDILNPSCFILKEQENDDVKSFGRNECLENGGHYLSMRRIFHPCEALYMTLRNVAFLYWRTRQICIHSFWNLFRASLGDVGISYFLVYTYYRDKNWIARLEFGFRKCILENY